MTRGTLPRAGIAAVLLSSMLVALVAQPGAAQPRTSGKVHQSVRGLSIPVHLTHGGVLYNHPPSFPRPDHVQGGPRPLPIGPYHSRAITPQTTFASFQQGGGGVHRSSPHVSLNIQTNTPAAVNVCLPANCYPPEPDEASDGKVVVETANTYVGFSVNGGVSFKSFTPGSLYSDDPNGGPCCDQVVQYAPQINRFIWITQYNFGKGGNDRYRIAVFPPSSVTAGGLTGGWGYWDITSNTNSSLPGLPYHWFDFPDLALGSRYLYVSFDIGIASTDKVYGSVICRIGLTNLQKGLNLAASPEPWLFISGGLLFGRVAQNTGSVAYWAHPVNTSFMNISDWPESGSLWYGPYTIPIASWPNANYTSKTSDGDSWNSDYTGAVLAAAVVQRDGVPAKLYLAWPGGRGTGQLSWLTQPHVEFAEIALPSLTFISQIALWNASVAVSFPELTVDPAGDVGIEVAFGGGKSWVNSAVGNASKAPTQMWSFTSSNTSDRYNRWGDFIGIRPAYGDSGAQFTAAGYGTDTSTSSGKIYDPHFVAFSVT